MIRLLIARHLVRGFEGVMRNDRLMAGWHLGLAAIALIAIVGEAGSVVLHGYAYQRHMEAAQGGRRSPCQH